MGDLPLEEAAEDGDESKLSTNNTRRETI